MHVVSFIAYGEPAPKGSRNQFGGEASKKTKPWMSTVANAGGEAFAGLPLFAGAVKVFATFAFMRPKSHFRTGKLSHLLRDDAPKYVTTIPDLDKLQRAIGDALTGVAFKDDKQIAAWVTEQVYDDRAYAHIEIRSLEEEPDGN